MPVLSQVYNFGKAPLFVKAVLLAVKFNVDGVVVSVIASVVVEFFLHEEIKIITKRNLLLTDDH